MEQVTILMVPFTAQGHLNQLLHFSLKLTSRHFPVHFASSESHIRQAKSRIQGWNSTSLETIHFHDLPLPPFPTPPPDPNSNFPNHLIPSFSMAMQLRSPLSSLYRSLSSDCHRLVVIYDPMMSFVSTDVAELANAESYRFQCVPSFIELHYYYNNQLLAGHVINPRQEALDVITDPFEGSITPEFWNFLKRNRFDSAAEAGTLFNTCRAIEGEFLDLITQVPVPRYRGKKIFAVGPLNPLARQGDVTEHRGECLSSGETEVIRWNWV